MDKEKALKIIGMIADGLDPYGEKAPAKDLPEINPVTIRAICTAIISLLSIKDKDELASKYETEKIFQLSESVSGPLQTFLVDKEKELILMALMDSNFNEKQAASALDITPHKLRLKLKAYKFNITILAKNYLDKESNVNLDDFLKKLEKRIIVEALEKTNYQKMVAAELLGISFRSLSYRLESINIEQERIDTKANYLEYFEIKSLDDFLKKVEKEILLQACKKTNFNRSQAADLLGISFRSLRYRVNQHGIRAA